MPSRGRPRVLPDVSKFVTQENEGSWSPQKLLVTEMKEQQVLVEKQQITVQETKTVTGKHLREAWSVEIEPVLNK